MNSERAAFLVELSAVGLFDERPGRVVPLPSRPLPAMRWQARDHILTGRVGDPTPYCKRRHGSPT